MNNENLWQWYPSKRLSLLSQEEANLELQHKGFVCFLIIESKGRQELLSIFAWPRQNVESCCLDSALYIVFYGLSTIEHAD